jgi:hypothetical protein
VFGAAAAAESREDPMERRRGRGRDHIDALSNKYVGRDHANPTGPHGRVILRIAADKTNTPSTMSRS